MRALFLLGRAIFGGYFVWNGLNHFQNRHLLAGYAATKGVSAPDLAIPASGALILGGGLSVLAGMKPREGLAAIVAFLIPVSLQMHRFWDAQDEARRASEMVNFTKNMALVGAALMLMQLEEPWPLSVDEARPAREDMYIRLGSRELRALPA